MTGFESIIDQKQPLGLLNTLLRSKNIPHALLFSGIEGIGKYTAAVTFAMACNCVGSDPGQLSEYKINNSGVIHQETKPKVFGKPCGSCRSCKKIQSDSHPDVLSIKPIGSFIKIDQIRGLYQTLTMKPYEGRYRVVIMTDAHCMNPSASNAFLKILEEPPEHTIFILITDKKSNLLQTVTSRCQHIQFKPISRSKLATMVSQKENTNMEDAIILATMAKGSLSKALSMNRSNWIGRRNWLISALGLDMSESNPSKSVRFLFAISAQLLKNREVLEDNLETIMSWLRDLIICKYQPENVIHKDLIDTLKNVSKKFTIKSLLHKIKEVQSTQLAMKRPNANMKLRLDLLMLKLAQP